MTDLRPRFGHVVYDYNTDVIDPLFCGPGAISILTGKPAREVERYVAFCRGQGTSGRVGGMRLHEIIRTLEVYGLVPVEIDVPWADGQHTFTYTNGNKLKAKVKRRPTLIRWLRASREDRGDDVYIVLTTSHIVVVKGDMLVDNITKEPVLYDTAKHHHRARVKSAYCIMQEN